MPADSEELIETSRADATKSDDFVSNEANAGKGALVEEQREQLDYLKAGGHSGITGEFGKPLLVPQFVDSFTTGDAVATAAAAVESFTTGDSKTAKTTDSNPVASWFGSIMGNIGNALQEATHFVFDGVKRMVGALAHWIGGGDKEIAEPVKPADLVMPDAVPAPTAYFGEGISVNVSADKRTCTASDTLDSLALAKLPSGSPPDMVEQYKKEIATINGFDTTKPIDLNGKEVLLPGHASDGSMSIIDANDRRTTRFKDGSESTADLDGRRYTRTPDGKGGFKETHSGPRPEDSFELTTTSDGKVSIADKPGETPHEVPATEAVKVMRRRLDNLAAEKITDPEKRAKFKADMLRFEDRGRNESPPLSETEVRKTYKEMERLLSKTGDTPLKQQERIAIAEQAMSQCARPSSIDQGQHDTCNMATVEAKTYTDHPSSALKLVADVATTGQYTATDGTKVEINPTATDSEAQRNPPVDGARSHASLIFQVTAANLYYQQQPYKYVDKDGNSRFVPPGKLEYQQQMPVSGKVPPDGGERLIDHSTEPPTTVMRDWDNNVPVDAPDIQDRAMVDVPALITGKHDAVMLSNDRVTTYEHTGVTTFKTENDLRNELIKLKEDRKLPVIFKVHTGQEPFLRDSGNGAAGGSGGWHVVTITDFDKTTGMAKVDNQWGSRVDHLNDGGVPVHDLFRTSRAPGNVDEEGSWWKPWDKNEVNPTIRELQKDVESNKARNIVDTPKELELLRIQYNYGGMKDTDYKKEMERIIDSTSARWDKERKDGTLDANEKSRTDTKLNDLIGNTRPPLQFDLLAKLHDNKLISDVQFSDRLGTSTRTFFAADHTDDNAEKVMTRLKELTDKMSPSDSSSLYSSMNRTADYNSRLELAWVENKVGVIDDTACDSLLESSAREYFSVKPRPEDEAKRYAARIKKVVESFAEPRRGTLLKRLPTS